jgi:flagellar M-ring protein FliF
MPIIDVDRLKRGGQKFASGFTPGQKVLSSLAVAGLALGLFAFTKWAATTDYAPLYSNLDSRDAGDITSELEGRGVQYKLTNGGTTIMVPKDSVYQTRLDMSSKGLPSGGDGYALLDRNGGSITQSEFSRRVDYQRAVQTELANTIMAMDGVRAATVNITLPTDDPFVGAEEPTAKAAVLLDLGSGELGAESTQAVVHLVSSSVADLSPDAVTVTDTKGNVLAAPGNDDALTSNQNLARTSAYETAMASKIEGMLAKSLGPGRATAVVTADMNFDKFTSVETEKTPEFDADGNVIPESSSTKDEEYNGAGGNTTGILGLDGTPVGGTQTPVSYKNSQADQINMADEVTKQIEHAGGEVDKISVAVMVDEEAVPGGTGALTELISTAAGIDPASGDTITVQPAKFDKDVQDAVAAQLSGAKSGASQTQMLGLARYLATLLIVALVLFIAWRSVKKAQLAMGPMRVPLDLAELEAAGLSTGSYGELAHINEALQTLSEPARQLEPVRSTVEQEVSDLIDRQPDEVAQTLRSWLADRRA